MTKRKEAELEGVDVKMLRLKFCLSDEDDRIRNEHIRGTRGEENGTLGLNVGYTAAPTGQV